MFWASFFTTSSRRLVTSNHGEKESGNSPDPKSPQGLGQTICPNNVGYLDDGNFHIFVSWKWLEISIPSLKSGNGKCIACNFGMQFVACCDLEDLESWRIFFKNMLDRKKAPNDLN